MKIIFKMNFKYEQDTNPKHNFPVNQLLCLNVLGCDGRKHVQNTFPKVEFFVTYKELGDSRWCRLGLTNKQVTPNLGKP